MTTNIRAMGLALISTLFLAGCPVAPIPGISSGSAKAPDTTTEGWDGEYRSPKMSVTIGLKDKALSGTITLNGKTFALTAPAPKDDATTGSFESEGTKFDVTLKRRADELTLVTGGTTYTLTRWNPANPLAKPNPLASAEPVATETPQVTPLADPPQVAPLADPPQADPPPTYAGTVNDFNWTVYKHPEGLSLRHPPEWTVQLPKTGLFLVPGDVAKNAQGQPLEIFVADADLADGVTDPASPRAAQLITKQVQSDFPFLHPQGQPERVTCRGGAGAIHHFAGTNPLGKPTMANVHVMITGDLAITLYAIGQADVVQKRMQTAKAIFQSYEFKRPAQAPTPAPTQTPAAGKLDPNLIGYWRHTNTYFSGGFSMTTDHHLLLAADGGAFWNSDSAGGMGGVSIRSSGEGWKYRGTWSVSGNVLNFNWTSHGSTTESHSYYIEGNSMLYKDAKPKLWKLIRR